MPLWPPTPLVSAGARWSLVFGIRTINKKRKNNKCEMCENEYAAVRASTAEPSNDGRNRSHFMQSMCFVFIYCSDGTFHSSAMAARAMFYAKLNTRSSASRCVPTIDP